MSVTAAGANQAPSGPSLRWDHARAVGTAAVVVPTVGLGLAAVGMKLIPDAGKIAGPTILKTAVIAGAVGLEVGLLHEYGTTRANGTPDGLKRGAVLGALAGATAVGAYYVAKPGWQSSLGTLRHASGVTLAWTAAAMVVGMSAFAITASHGASKAPGKDTGNSTGTAGGSCQPA